MDLLTDLPTRVMAVRVPPSSDSTRLHLQVLKQFFPLQIGHSAWSYSFWNAVSGQNEGVIFRTDQLDDPRYWELGDLNVLTTFHYPISPTERLACLTDPRAVVVTYTMTNAFLMRRPHTPDSEWEELGTPSIAALRQAVARTCLNRMLF